MNTTAINFMMSYSSFRVVGFNSDKCFQIVAKNFKRQIIAIKLTKRKGLPDSRTYYFTDQSSCTYQDNHFTLKS